jgi:hypothetical protein
LQIIFLAQIGNVQKVNYDCRFNSKFGWLADISKVL